MSPITTHVLDTALGSPAKGIKVVLFRVPEQGDPIELGQGVTNKDGRIVDLLPEGESISGKYCISFETAPYFAESNREAFYPRIEVLFEVSAGGGHYHVPLLLSPFGYSTYRGS